ncbi:molybdopterin cofactor-binding domain-containing protein, partial [Falsiroseomonas sp.]
ELAEKLGIDPIELRIRNEPETVPSNPARRFSDRHLTRCLREGAARFGWSKRSAKPGVTREGRWLIGMGVAAGYRGAPTMKSAARIKLDADGRITVQTDMTDIGTGSYTIIAQ